MQSLADLGTLRGLSAATLALCHVEAVGKEHPFGMGWVWDTYTLQGAKAQRWKSVSSLKPEGATGWAKYRWHPEKPGGDASYFDPDYGLKDAIKAALGALYIVGGEIAAMSMFEAGFRNTTCFFGDETIPRDTLYRDLKALGVDIVFMIPDRDLPGQKCACTVRDLLALDPDFEFAAYALPYEVVDKHGKDINDWWLDLQQDREALREGVDKLPLWTLPETKPAIIEFPQLFGNTEGLPPRFAEAILSDVQRRASPSKPFRWGSDGWSSNFRCPFHDDTEASAGFNKESMSFKCFACGAKSAKEYGEGVGIYLKDYYDDPVPKAHSNGTAPTVKEKPTVETPQLRPKLPDFARLTTEQVQLACQGRVWLDDYLKWAIEASPLTPPIFHEAMALWLLATVSTRRMHVAVGGEDIYPNLYILIVGKTTVYRKSTAMKLVKNLLYKANLASLLLPSDATPEALFDELAGIKPPNFEALPEETRQRWYLGRSVAAQRSFLKDEASSIFGGMKRDYMAGFSELLLEGYDGDAGTIDKRLKSKGIMTVKDPCLSFLGATTPVMFAKYIGTEENENGLIVRFAIITPEAEIEYRDPGDRVEIPYGVVMRIRHLFMDVLPWHNGQRPSASIALNDVTTPPTATALFNPDALSQLYKYRRAMNHELQKGDALEDAKRGGYARLATMAFKVALLLAAIDADELPIRIEEQHAYAAQQICESWRESLHRLDGDIARSLNRGSHDEKVMNLLRQSGAAGVTMREIMKICGLKDRNQTVNVLTVLADEGLVEKYDYKPGGAGRPTVRYRIPVSTQ